MPSYEDYDRLEDKLSKQIMQVVYGLRGPRKRPISHKQVLKHFRGTKAKLVSKQLWNLSCEQGYLEPLFGPRTIKDHCRWHYALTQAGKDWFDELVRRGICKKR